MEDNLHENDSNNHKRDAIAQACSHTRRHRQSEIPDKKKKKRAKKNCQDWDSNPSISRYCGTPLFRGKKLNFLEHSALDHSAILAYLLKAATRICHYGLAIVPKPQRIVKRSKKAHLTMSLNVKIGIRTQESFDTVETPLFRGQDKTQVGLEHSAFDRSAILTI